MKPQPEKVVVERQTADSRTIDVYYSNSVVKDWIESNCWDFGNWWHYPDRKMFVILVNPLYKLGDVISYIETMGEENV